MQCNVTCDKTKFDGRGYEHQRPPPQQHSVQKVKSTSACWEPGHCQVTFGISLDCSGVEIQKNNKGNSWICTCYFHHDNLLPIWHIKPLWPLTPQSSRPSDLVMDYTWYMNTSVVVYNSQILSQESMEYNYPRCHEVDWSWHIKRLQPSNISPANLLMGYNNWTPW